jgi:hypothetical protein
MRRSHVCCRAGRDGGPVSTGCRVDEVQEVSPELAMRLRELVAQLSSSAKAPTDDELEGIAGAAGHPSARGVR